MPFPPFRRPGSWMLPLPILLGEQGGQTGSSFSGIPITFSAAGVYQWICPENVFEIGVYAYGGGGGGWQWSGGNGAGGGGGGGAFSFKNIPVTPGNIYEITVGAGGANSTNGKASFFSDNQGNVLMLAAGGQTPGGNNNPGVGGAASSSIGDIVFSGGGSDAGHSALGSQSGNGGGASGNILANGNRGLDGGSSGPGGAGGVGLNGGGSGGAGGNSSAVGNPGLAPGGGGGGGGADPEPGGAGAPGSITILPFIPPTPGAAPAGHLHTPGPPVLLPFPLFFRRQISRGRTQAPGIKGRGITVVANEGSSATFPGKRGITTVANEGSAATFTGSRGITVVANEVAGNPSPTKTGNTGRPGPPHLLPFPLRFQQQRIAPWVVNAIVSQVATEALVHENTTARISQVATEVLIKSGIYTILAGTSNLTARIDRETTQRADHGRSQHTLRGVPHLRPLPLQLKLNRPPSAHGDQHRYFTISLAGSSSLSTSVYPEIFDSSTTWTCPPGVFTVNVAVYGGGGGGSHTGALSGGGGGGGGAYAERSIPVTPGNVYTITVGAAGAFEGTGGDSQFVGDGGVTVLAKGGTGASGQTQGTGGQASSSIGDVVFSGGDGGVGETSTLGAGEPGAGGGASGNPSGAGNPGQQHDGGGNAGPGGVGVDGGGSGGAGGNYFGPGNPGLVPGGGGGGDGGFNNSTTGTGAHGRVIITIPSGVFHHLTPTFAGTSALSTTLRKLHKLTVTLAGQGHLTVSTTGTDNLTLHLAGLGQLRFNGIGPVDISPIRFAGTSRLSVETSGGSFHLTLVGRSSLATTLHRAQFVLSLFGLSSITFPGFGTQSVQMSQITQETLSQATDPGAVVSQVTEEILVNQNTTARVSQVTLEVLRSYTSVRVKTRYGVKE